MKRCMIACVVGVIGTACLTSSMGQNQGGLRDFMRAKLKHSQNVVEGLVLNDFEKIGKEAQELSLLSLAATWQVLETQEYHDYSKKFRLATESLRDAAKKKDLAEATASYNRVTLSCVECHKYLRGVRMAAR